MSEKTRTMAFISLAFIGLCGFMGLLAVAFGFLNNDWFAMIFGAMTGATAVIGMSLIIVHAKPLLEKAETDQQVKE